MAITINIQLSGTSRKITIPYKPKVPISELITEIVKRASLDADKELKLFYNGAELFGEDTLSDLSINDNSELILARELSKEKPQPSEDPKKVEEKPGKIELSAEELLSAMSISAPKKKIVKQIDMVVLDLSGSMKSKAFPDDPDASRIVAAQAFFQAYIDKYHQHEVSAVVGLVCFGEKIELTFPITTTFESFSTELGNVVANQDSTRLYEAILFAASTIDKYRQSPSVELSPDVICRIFCLTDGQDNSGVDPFVTYQFLKKNHVIVDSIGIGNSDFQALSQLTRATGGSCFQVASVPEGVALFEREAVVSVSVRQNFKPFSLEISSKEALASLKGETFAKNIEIKAAPEMTQKSIKASEVKLDKVDSSASAKTKRLLLEFKNFSALNSSTFQIFVDENDFSFWKIAMKGQAGTPYEGYWFLLTCKFPDDYPFKAPALRFATPIYHCNINNDGKMCLDILNHSWSPALQMSNVMNAVATLLLEPNPDDALDSVKGAKYQDFKKHGSNEYMEEAKQWAKTKASKTFDELAKLWNLNQ